MGDELKDCPFCGATPKEGGLGGEPENWCIWCPNCGVACAEVIDGKSVSRDEAVKLWNTRKPSDDERLRDAAQRVIDAWRDGKITTNDRFSSVFTGLEDALTAKPKADSDGGAGEGVERQSRSLQTGSPAPTDATVEGDKGEES